MAAGWILRRRLTRFELALSVALVMTLVWVFIGRARALMAVAEQHAFVASVSGVRTGLAVTALGALARGDLDMIGSLADTNPLGVVVARPPNFVGERRDAEAEQVPGAAWYYDPDARLLVYRVEHAERFHSALGGAPRARFRVALRYLERSGDSRFGRGDLFQGIDLQAVESYRWGPPAGGD